MSISEQCSICDVIKIKVLALYNISQYLLVPLNTKQLSNVSNQEIKGFCEFPTLKMKSKNYERQKTTFRVPHMVRRLI